MLAVEVVFGDEIAQAILWESEWKIPGIIMKIGMKMPRQYNENRNEISQALLWKLEWNRTGLDMKIPPADNLWQN